MKGTSLIVSIVLFIAVAVLYVLHFTGGSGKGQNSGSDDRAVISRDGLKIAYVKADSVILNYKLAEFLHDDFTKKQEAYTSEYASKRQSFEKDAAAFQEKLQRGGFLSEQSAVRERDRLVGIEQEILKMDQDLSAKLGEMQNTNGQQVLDSLQSCLKSYNVSKKYDYILNASSILIGDEGDNITADILKLMNDKYGTEEKK
ncbi:MAG TPA: OmpH family outer membrane protein [Draconibacterium sp.]|nr:OmpH family outer membrane protein [Draconibacterium sp.]